MSQSSGGIFHGQACCSIVHSVIILLGFRRKGNLARATWVDGIYRLLIKAGAASHGARLQQA